MDKGSNKLQDIYVADKAAPVGKVRRLLGEELWVMQGRTIPEWEELVQDMHPEEVAKEACRATGRRTALRLLGALARPMRIRRLACVGTRRIQSPLEPYCAG